MGDASVAGWEVAQAAVERSRHDLDAVAAGVLEGKHLPHAAQFALLLAAVAHRMAGILDLRASPVEVLRIAQVEAGNVIGRMTFEIYQRVVARVAAHRRLVAAEISRLGLAADKLQADDLR